MKIIAFLLIAFSQVAAALSSQEFNKTLWQGVDEDMKQNRFQENQERTLRQPASVEREEIPQLELQKKNKVNGLQDKW